MHLNDLQARNFAAQDLRHFLHTAGGQISILPSTPPVQHALRPPRLISTSRPKSGLKRMATGLHPTQRELAGARHWSGSVTTNWFLFPEVWVGMAHLHQMGFAKTWKTWPPQTDRLPPGAGIPNIGAHAADSEMVQLPE